MFLSQLQVNSGFGKGVNSLCAKCIRQSSQITAPIQLVNGLHYTAVSHKGSMETATFSVHKMCKLLGFFNNKCSKNAQRNLKGPTRHSLGKKTSLHLLQSIATILLLKALCRTFQCLEYWQSVFCHWLTLLQSQSSGTLLSAPAFWKQQIYLRSS